MPHHEWLTPLTTPGQNALNSAVGPLGHYDGTPRLAGRYTHLIEQHSRPAAETQQSETQQSATRSNYRVFRQLQQNSRTVQISYGCGTRFMV